MSDTPPPVDYAPPPPKSRMVGQCVRAAFATAGLLTVAVVGVMVVAFAQGEGGGSTAWFPYVAIGGGVAALVLMNYVAYREYRNPARRGYAFGIWIGLGIALLIQGVCFGRVL